MWRERGEAGIEREGKKERERVRKRDTAGGRERKGEGEIKMVEMTFCRKKHELV